MSIPAFVKCNPPYASTQIMQIIVQSINQSIINNSSVGTFSIASHFTCSIFFFFHRLEYHLQNYKLFIFFLPKISNSEVRSFIPTILGNNICPIYEQEISRLEESWQLFQHTSSACSWKMKTNS